MQEIFCVRRASLILCVLQLVFDVIRLLIAVGVAATASFSELNNSAHGRL